MLFFISIFLSTANMNLKEIRHTKIQFIYDFRYEVLNKLQNGKYYFLHINFMADSSITNNKLSKHFKMNISPGFVVVIIISLFSLRIALSA